MIRLLTRGWNGKRNWALFSSIPHLIGQRRRKYRTEEITLRSMDMKERTSTRLQIPSWCTALLELVARPLRPKERSPDLVEQSRNFVRTRGFSTKDRLVRDRFRTGQRSKGSLSPQSEMNNFRGSIHAQRKPVPNAVRDNKFALAAAVKSRPITEHGGPKSQLLVQH